MKRDPVTLLLILMLLAGLGLICYPTVSQLWNRHHQSRLIAGYIAETAGLDGGARERALEAARAYNAALPPLHVLSDAERADYLGQLNLTDSGIMGDLEIPRLRLSLPIYHGAGESVLQIAVGHIEGTALPVGGLGTHCALTGHRGLPSARLFTDLNKLAVGDTFQIRVAGETLTYEVDQIRTVAPADVSALAADPALDLCTLVTCTPYGLNTHRLLVRGHRVEDAPQAVRADAAPAPNAQTGFAPALPLALLPMAARIWKRRRTG